MIRWILAPHQSPDTFHRSNQRDTNLRSDLVVSRIVYLRQRIRQSERAMEFIRLMLKPTSIRQLKHGVIIASCTLVCLYWWRSFLYRLYSSSWNVSISSHRTPRHRWRQRWREFQDQVLGQESKPSWSLLNNPVTYQRHPSTTKASCIPLEASSRSAVVILLVVGGSVKEGSSSVHRTDRASY